MTNNGNDESIHKPTQDKRSIFIFLLIGIGVVVAILIAFPVISVLLAIIFPPMPPLPEQAQEVRYENFGYGVDDWLFDVADDACSSLAVYASSDGDCTIEEGICDASLRQSRFTPDEHVGQCSGVINFSIFALRWDAVIANDDTEGHSRLRLTREVFWTGSVPPRKMDSLID
ncbi:hypothetical protein MASR2M15_21590 [Anaerolineales bacterium]